MIPDFLNEKTEIMNYWNNYLDNKINEYSGILRKIPKHVNHEGNRWFLKRADGTEDDQLYNELESMFNIKINEIPSLTHRKIESIINRVASDIVRKLSLSFYSKVDTAVRDSGNTIDGQGKPFTKELLLEALSKIYLDFDDDGNLIPPTLVMHPNMWNAKKDEFKSWENDEEFKDKFNKLIKRKREEWRVREDNRKLVD